MTTYSLYDGKLDLVYEQRGRKKGYWVGKDKVLRVTEIAPPIPFTAGAMYGAKCAVDYIDQYLTPVDIIHDIGVDDVLAGARKAPLDSTARDQGTEGHALIEAYLQGQMPIVPEYLEKQWKHFLAWEKKQSITVWHVEKKVYSRLYQYAGTCDFMGEVNNWPTNIDWKFTGNDAKKRDSYAIQTAAYTQAYSEEHGHEPPAAYKRLTLTITEKGVKEYWSEDFQGDFEAFKHLLGYYRWAKGLPHLGAL